MTGRHPRGASALPDEAVLGRRISRALRVGHVRVLSRRTLGSGTFPKEVVSCADERDTQWTLFCKYSAPRSAAFGHRGGIAYEARVYRDVLSLFEVSRPEFIDAGGSEDGDEWLMLRFLEDAARVKHRWHRMPDAAAWLGRFHRQGEPRLKDASFSFLNTYDREYYIGWADRALSYAADHLARMRWVEPLREWYVTMAGIGTLQETPLHGEFTIKNVLVVDRAIVPTDWETAAIGVGEIDLMTLIDGCDHGVREACIDAYASARWPHRVPQGADERAVFAELYVHFRWLADDPDGTRDGALQWRFERLAELADRLGFSS